MHMYAGFVTAGILLGPLQEVIGIPLHIASITTTVNLTG